jgi:hypothetical protein
MAGHVARMAKTYRRHPTLIEWDCNHQQIFLGGKTLGRHAVGGLVARYPQLVGEVAQPEHTPVLFRVGVAVAVRGVESGSGLEVGGW